MRVPYMLCATVTAVALLAAPGCSKVVTGNASRDTHAPQPTPNECEQVSAPLTTIDPRAAGEPQLKIPQPPGWERASMLDSDVIRFMTYVATMSVQSTDPDNSAYARDTATVLTGFQMLPPAEG